MEIADALGRWATDLDSGIVFKVHSFVTHANGSQEFQGRAPDGTAVKSVQLITLQRDMQVLFNSIFHGGTKP